MPDNRDIWDPKPAAEPAWTPDPLTAWTPDPLTAWTPDPEKPWTPPPEKPWTAPPEPVDDDLTGSAAPAAQAPEQRDCQWCSAIAPADAVNCPSCGANLAERESIGGVPIPGVTEVDPGVLAAERAARSSLARARKQSTVIGPVIGFVPGGMIGHAVASAVDAYLVHKLNTDDAQSNPYKDPSYSAWELAAQHDQDFGIGAAGGADADADAGAAGELGATTAPVNDPWSDLPPPSIEEQVAESELGPWATAAPRPNEFDPWANSAAQVDPAAPVSDPWSTEGGPWSADPASGPWSQDQWTQDQDPKKPR